MDKKKKLAIGAAVVIGGVGLGGVTANAASVQQIAASAVPVANANGLYPSVMIAQAILESGGGTSQLATQYNNYFGVKYTGGEGVDLPTTEYVNGQLQTMVQKFQVYPSVAASFEAEAALLRTSFYSGTWRANTSSYLDATAYLQGRYATNPNYAGLLNNIIAEYDLTAYDGGSYTATAASSGGGATYTVQAGDTLSAIAAANSTTVAALASANGISNVNAIQVGQVLSLTGEGGGGIAAGGSASATGTYTVKEGDSLWSIAQANGTTAVALASLNGISENSILQIGQTLSLSSASTASSGGGTYTVKAGDTLSAIAAAYGTTVSQIVEENGLSNPDFIAVGQVLRV